jgi:hypothetical protein
MVVEMQQQWAKLTTMMSPRRDWDCLIDNINELQL